MIIAWWGLAFAAEPCVDVQERLTAAWSAFNDAEVVETERLLDLTISDLGCQTRPLEEEELFTLFAFDATASLANNDQDGATSAAIRGVTMAPDRQVDARFGPEVAALFDTWRHRLRSASLTVRVAGPNPLRVDGHDLQPDALAVLVQGPHVLQWVTKAGFHTEVREIEGDVDVWTDRVEDAVVVVPERPQPPAPPPTDTPTDPQPPVTRRKSAPAVWGTGIALAAAGGGLVVAGWRLGERFEANPYSGPQGGVGPKQPGYAEARAEVIRQDATTIRAILGTGYGLLGVGGVLFGVGFAVHGSPTGGSLTISVPLR